MHGEKKMINRWSCANIKLLHSQNIVIIPTRRKYDIHDFDKGRVFDCWSLSVLSQRGSDSPELWCHSLFLSSSTLGCDLKRMLYHRVVKFKRTINNRTFQSSFFFKPPDFFFILRENSTLINYLYNNSLGNNIFLERETILCCWELKIAGDN